MPDIAQQSTHNLAADGVGGGAGSERRWDQVRGLNLDGEQRFGSRIHDPRAGRSRATSRSISGGGWNEIERDGRERSVNSSAGARHAPDGFSGNPGINDCIEDSEGNATGDSWTSIDPTKQNSEGTGAGGTLIHEMVHMQQCNNQKGKANPDKPNKPWEDEAKEISNDIMEECADCNDTCPAPKKKKVHKKVK